ncbi:MAG: hypothetical protein R3F46_05220 [bacterium]
MQKICAVLPLLAIVLLASTAATSRPTTEPAVALKVMVEARAFDRLAQHSIAVLPLDSPGNPYAGQYSEIDSWILEHALADPSELHEQAEYETGELAYVTEAGYMIPVYVQLHTAEALKSSGRYPALEDQPLYSISAKGQMDTALAESHRDRLQLIRAQYFPQIPAWLADNPPPKSMFTDTGSVITIGLPGEEEHRPDAAYDVPASPPSYYLLSGAGVQLAGPANTVNELFGAERWQAIYDDMSRKGWASAETGQGFRARTQENRSAGVFQFRNAGGEIIGIFNYDGTELSEQTAPVRDAHLFSFINNRMLPDMYEAQQRIAGQG